ncbi:MAG TPA: YetF domain-containing protein [Thermomicrobiales bacterium]|nr:YetF domain-containing protein [Thermomicrobiales bacterium]
MDEVLRAIAIYAVLMVIFRLSGKRSMAEVTPFDFVLLLIFSEALQNALVDDDSSLTVGLTVVATLLMVNLIMSLIKQRSVRIENILEGVPIVIFDEGKPLHDRMNRERIDEGDILAAARMQHGIDSLDQVRTAIIERSGGISIIPKQSEQ